MKRLAVCLILLALARRLYSSCYGKAKRRNQLPPRVRTGSIIKKPPRGTYRFMWAPDHPLARADHYVLEHRMVAYDAGLLTDPDHQQVHHINGDQLDNRVENLQAVTPSEHRRIHAEQDGTTNQYGHWSAT